MHLLPLNIAKLVNVADQKDSTRFALSAVHLKLNDNGSFLAEATDSKRLIRVRGTVHEVREEYPQHGPFDAAPETPGKSRFLVPQAAWQRAFTMANKVGKRARHKPILKTVAVKLAETATFAATDLDSYPVEQTREIEGRYPPVDDILKQSCREAGFEFSVDAKMFGELLLAMASMQGGDDKSVKLYSAGPGKPVYLAGKGENGERLEAIMMALASDEKRGAKPEMQHSDAPAPKPQSSAVEPVPAVVEEPEAAAVNPAEAVEPAPVEPTEIEAGAQAVAPVVGFSAMGAETIIERRNAGVSWATLAASLNCPVSTLRNRVKRHLAGAVESAA
jgi:hypothetical protein